MTTELYQKALEIVDSLTRESNGKPVEKLSELKTTLETLRDEQKEIIYRNFCPFDYKYRDEALEPILSAEAEIKAYATVQTALMKGLYKFGLATEQNVKELEEAVNKIKASRVYYLEDNVTKHDINALNRALEELVSEDTARKIHPGTTSYDIIDTARAFMYKRAIKEVTQLRELKILGTLLNLSEKHAEQVQVGRTHGQWTSPTTFGYVMATYANAFAYTMDNLDRATNGLEGKIAGIVGTHASPATIVGKENALEFERYVLEDVLGLKQSKASSQITRREPLMDLGNSIVAMENVLADMSNSMRHLQRTEIAEVGEFYEKNMQVGSSADPNKQNPINFENAQGMSSIVKAGQSLLYQIGVSDHQRDLTNSVIARFEPIHMILGLNNSLKRLDKTMGKLLVHKENMNRHVAESGKYSKAECMTTILKKYDFPDAHETVRKWSIKAKENERDLLHVAELDENFKNLWESKFTMEEKEYLTYISKYTGLASEKTKAIVKELREKFNLKAPTNLQ